MSVVFCCAICNKHKSTSKMAIYSICKPCVTEQWELLIQEELKMDGYCYLCRTGTYGQDGACSNKRCIGIEPGFRTVPKETMSRVQGASCDIEPVSYGYHSKKIQKGILGEYSKIREEFEEFEDALILKNPVMALVELSDLIGAIEAYAVKHHAISFDELVNMKNATQRAFEQGHRK